MTVIKTQDPENHNLFVQRHTAQTHFQGSFLPVPTAGARQVKERTWKQDYTPP